MRFDDKKKNLPVYQQSHASSSPTTRTPGMLDGMAWSGGAQSKEENLL